MKKEIIIVVSLSFGLLGCQRQLHSNYTSAYKKGTLYFARTDISFLQDSTFSRTDWTDHIGYDQQGKGKYLLEGRKVILQYEDFENEISHHKLNTTEQNLVFIKSVKKSATFPIQLEIRGRDNEKIIGYKVILLNSARTELNNYYSDINGTITINVESLEPSYVLNSQYLKSESLNFEIYNTMNLDTLIVLADHIPYIEKGRIDTFQIKSNGKYIENINLKREKLKKMITLDKK